VEFPLGVEFVSCYISTVCTGKVCVTGQNDGGVSSNAFDGRHGYLGMLYSYIGSYCCDYDNKNTQTVHRSQLREFGHVCVICITIYFTLLFKYIQIFLALYQALCYIRNVPSVVLYRVSQEERT
jgi:hypothetical protein